MTYQSNKQETEKQYAVFGQGGWVSDRYILKECPLCNEEYSFHFQGLTGQWRCTSCNKAGDTDVLKGLLKNDLFLMDRLAEMQEPSAPEGLIQIGKYIPPRRGQSIATGFSIIDQKLSGLYESELTIISGKRGEGKCLTKGTKVVMFSGELKCVEDLVVGDRLMGIDSKPRTIMNLCFGVDEIYWIHQNKGNDYFTTLNHVLCLYSFLDKSYVEITVKDFMKKNITWQRLAYGYRNPIDFDNKEVRIDPYFLGIWLGDGTKKETSITTPDFEVSDFLESYSNELGQKMSLRAVKGKAKTLQIVGIRFKHEENSLLSRLKSYNLINNKHIPNDFLYNSREKRLQLLAGIIDADGFLNHNCYEIVQKNRTLSMQIQYLANSLGYRCKFKACRKTCYNNGVEGTYYRTNIYGNVQEIPVRVERKKIKEFNKSCNPYQSGITIKHLGEGEYVGFETDVDNKFLLEDFTVTHNSTFSGQLALNVMNAGARVCFYSGELNAGMFQSWVVAQAAGEKYMNAYADNFGAERHKVDAFIEARIKSWFIDRLLLYDNSVKNASERNSIIDRFLLAKKYYGCNVFFVDNLMTAKYTKDTERDYFRQQANFVGELIDFAHQEHAHVILVAHPKKGDTGDDNENVAGLSDITNKASNVFTIHRLTAEERKRDDFDSLVTISKNRNYGALAKLGFDFNVASKRFMPRTGTVIEHYAWEEEL